MSEFAGAIDAPPFVPGAPIVGNALNLNGRSGISVEFLQKIQQQYGDVAQFKAFNQSMYVVSDPALVREILLTRVSEFLKPDEGRNSSAGLSRFLGQGILTAGYEQWKPQRKLIQPLMQHQRIAGYAESMVTMGQRLLASWQSGQLRDIHADMTQVTMWIIAEVMFDIGVEQSQAMEEMGKAAQKIVIDDFAAPLPDWLTRRHVHAAKINAELTALVDRFIAERREKGFSERNDLLSVLMNTRDEDGNTLSDELLRSNIVTMFFAGHETTANTLTWALYYLAQHPQVLRALQQELDGVLADGHVLGVEDLPRLPYTLMVIKETMRYQPIVSMTPRYVANETTLGAYKLQAGSFVLLPFYSLHHDERYWEQPEAFDPLRFLPEREAQIGKYVYLPFGGGPRICIGNHFALMEAQILLALVASQYTFELQPGARVEPVRYVTCSPRNGLPMTVRPRALV